MIGPAVLTLLRWARNRAREWADYLDMWHDILDPEYLERLVAEGEAHR